MRELRIYEFLSYNTILHVNTTGACFLLVWVTIHHFSVDHQIEKVWPPQLKRETQNIEHFVSSFTLHLLCFRMAL